MKKIRIFVPIAILFIMGGYLLKQEDNAFSKAFSRDKYDYKKVSTLLELACFGIAISCIPSLLRLSVIFQKMVKCFFYCTCLDILLDLLRTIKL